MKLQHYLGGLEGLGATPFEKRVFVELWEKRIFGIHVAMMALSAQLPLPQTSSRFNTVWTWADLRKGAESLNPFDYFKYRYYEKWLGGISQYFIEKGYLTEEELDARTRQMLQSSSTPKEGGDPSIDARVIKYLIDGDSPKHDSMTQPRFAAGERVLVKNPPTIEHTRLPGHLRNRIGAIDTVYPAAYSYLTSTGPDGIGPPMPVYCVRFDPQDIWKGNTETNEALYADLFEAYLEKPN